MCSNRTGTWFGNVISLNMKFDIYFTFKTVCDGLHVAAFPLLFLERDVFFLFLISVLL